MLDITLGTIPFDIIVLGIPLETIPLDTIGVIVFGMKPIPAP